MRFHIFGENKKNRDFDEKIHNDISATRCSFAGGFYGTKIKLAILDRPRDRAVEMGLKTYGILGFF